VCLQPPATALLAALLLGEVLQLQDAAGMALILAGMMLVVLSKHFQAQAVAVPPRVTLSGAFDMPSEMTLHLPDDDDAPLLALLGGGSASVAGGRKTVSLEMVRTSSFAIPVGMLEVRCTVEFEDQRTSTSSVGGGAMSPNAWHTRSNAGTEAVKEVEKPARTSARGQT